MSKRASEELLGSLHDAIARDLLTRVRSGEATSAELSAAIKFLKDNGIEALMAENSALQQLAATALPIFDDSELELDD